MSGKGMPLTKEEVKKLVELITANPVVYSKATNANNNQLKEAAWIKITDHFNSVITSCPRRPEQLRLKWENLKKAARKRSSYFKMNSLKTGGGKTGYILSDDTLNAVAGLLGKLKQQAVTDELENSIIKRNKTISRYYELKSRKLELEVLEMEKKLCHSSKKDP